jgi:hypothetical protein
MKSTILVAFYCIACKRMGERLGGHALVAIASADRLLSGGGQYGFSRR